MGTMIHPERQARLDAAAADAGVRVAEALRASFIMGGAMVAALAEMSSRSAARHSEPKPTASAVTTHAHAFPDDSWDPPEALTRAALRVEPVAMS